MELRQINTEFINQDHDNNNPTTEFVEAFQDKFTQVFTTPHGLPPKWDMDHMIHVMLNFYLYW